MFIFTMVNLLVEYHNNRYTINNLPVEERYKFPMLISVTDRSMDRTNCGYTGLNTPRFCEDVYQIGNFVLYPCGTSGHMDSVRGIVIEVLNDKRESLEIYGVKKEIEVIPLILKYGWKIRGPWVKDLQTTMKQFKKEMVAFTKLQKKKEEAIRQEEKMKEVEGYNQKINSFKSKYKG
jgi:hypothetical protein